jgi:hypothetical protein
MLHAPEEFLENYKSSVTLQLVPGFRRQYCGLILVSAIEMPYFKRVFVDSQGTPG